MFLKAYGLEKNVKVDQDSFFQATAKAALILFRDRTTQQQK